MRSANGENQRDARVHIAFATCPELPELDADSQRLVAPLAAAGIDAIPAVWDDPHVDWASFDLVIVRSCWDYLPRRAAFLAWTQHVPRLANPASVLAWNSDKRYLLDLQTRHIPIVPTAWIGPHDAWQPPEHGEWVIKPAVSMASLDSGRYRVDDDAERRLAVAHVQRLQSAGRVTMVQPYLHHIDAEGETSLVYLGGAFTHGVRKDAVLTGPDTGIDRRFAPDGGLRLRECQPTPAQIELADRVLAAVPRAANRLLYARVDVVPDTQGRPVLMELELIEPQLYLRSVPRAAELMAAAIAAHAHDGWATAVA